MYLAGKRMRQVGAKMKVLADKEVENGQSEFARRKIFLLNSS
jgi:hypothetical protein